MQKRGVNNVTFFKKVIKHHYTQMLVLQLVALPGNLWPKRRVLNIRLPLLNLVETGQKKGFTPFTRRPMLTVPGTKMDWTLELN